MTKTVELDVAQATLSELVAALTPDDEVVIMKNHQPVAKLVAAPPTPSPRVPGLMKGKLTVIAEDDEHLKDFEEYMP
jgi:antitoxin (DNA-binding transcriptional repressor) of toxin-antitoxin stability system